MKTKVLNIPQAEYDKYKALLAEEKANKLAKDTLVESWEAKGLLPDKVKKNLGKSFIIVNGNTFT